MYEQHPSQTGQAPARTPGIAIASVVLGAAGFILLLLCSIPAIITGHIALRRINRSNGALGGSGLAIAGLVLGYLSTLFSMFAVSVAIAGFASGRQAIEQAKRNKARAVCASLETAILAFHAEYARLPGDDAVNADAILTTNDAHTAKLLNVLLGHEEGANPENVKQNLFFSAQEAHNDRDGLVYAAGHNEVTALLDPWGNPYHMVIDYDYDHAIPNPFGAGQIRGQSVLVYSFGPNGANDAGQHDDVKSW